MGQTDFYMGEGDRLPTIAITLEDESGPIDLTGYTVTVYGRKIGAATTFSGTCTVDPDQVANKGAVSYAWASGDTQVYGGWYIQWKASIGGKTVTFPNTGTDELFVNNFWAGAQP